MGQAGKFLGIATQEPERKTYPKPKKPEGSKAAAGQVLEWLTVTRKISPEAVKAYRVAEHKGTHVMFPHFRDGQWLNLGSDEWYAIEDYPALTELFRTLI